MSEAPKRKRGPAPKHEDDKRVSRTISMDKMTEKKLIFAADSRGVKIGQMLDSLCKKLPRPPS